MPVCGGGAPPVHGQLASLSYRIGASTVLSCAGASVYLGESVMNLATRGLEPTTLYAYMPDGVVSSRPWATRRPHDHPWCHRPERLRLDRRRNRHAAPRMPRPLADHRAMPPDAGAARVRRALQHPPPTPIARSALARRAPPPPCGATLR